MTYDFTVAGNPGARRATGWHISGDGGSADVSLTASEAGGVTQFDVLMPAQGLPTFPTPDGPRRLSAEISPDLLIHVHLRVDGRRRTFQLDSGTPEIVFGGDASRATGATELGHGVARNVDVDDSIASAAPFGDVGGLSWEDGLLGYDFFRGRIVHVDYGGHVDVEPRASFVPPPSAVALPTDWSEGMPIVSATVGDAVGSRFLLDLGSQRLILSHTFADRAALRATGQRETFDFLEGEYSANYASVSSLILGPARIHDQAAFVEKPNRENLDIPLDGIIGADVLAHFEWWFDADGPVTWLRVRR